MIESPLIQEIVARSKHEAIVLFLEARFGAVPADVTVHLTGILDEQRLQDLTRYAARCPDLEAFRARLSSL
jgi:hypothetical protein